MRVVHDCPHIRSRFASGAACPRRRLRSSPRRTTPRTRVLFFRGGLAQGRQSTRVCGASGAANLCRAPAPGRQGGLQHPGRHLCRQGWRVFFQATPVAGARRTRDKHEGSSTYSRLFQHSSRIICGSSEFLGKFTFPYFFGSFSAQTLGIWPLTRTPPGPPRLTPGSPRSPCAPQEGG